MKTIHGLYCGAELGRCFIDEEEQKMGMHDLHESLSFDNEVP
jgi:hypothetical protein